MPLIYGHVYIVVKAFKRRAISLGVFLLHHRKSQLPRKPTLCGTASEEIHGARAFNSFMYRNQSRMSIVPSSATGKPGANAASHRCPSGSAKYPE